MKRVSFQHDALMHPAQPPALGCEGRDLPDRTSRSTIAGIDPPPSNAEAPPAKAPLPEAALGAVPLGSPSLRARRDGWTTVRQAAFFDTLRAGASVAAAATAVGMSRESAYRLRRNPRAGDFAARWAAIDAMPRVGPNLDAMFYDEHRDGPSTTRLAWLDARATRPRFDGWLIRRLTALEKRRPKA